MNLIPLNFITQGEQTPLRRMMLERALAGGGALSEYEVTGNPAVFQTNVAKPLTGFTIPFLPVQSGTGDPSPSNVRPISGWQGVKAFQPTGVNRWDEQWEVGQYNSSGIPASGTNQIRSKNLIPVEPETEYYLYIGINQNCRIYFCAENGSVISYQAQGKGTFTTPANCRWLKFHTGNGYGETYNDNISINYPATETGYNPFATVYPVTFPDGQTIYGGTLDAVNGVLTVEYAAKVVRGTDSFYASTGYIKSDAFDAFLYIDDVYGSLGMCNMLKRSNAGICGDVGYPNTFRLNGTQCHINIANELLGITDYTQETTTTATQKLKAWLEELYNNGTPLIVVYPISTPYEIPLSDIPVPVTLIGDNTIWTDTNGENTVKYKKKG